MGFEQTIVVRSQVSAANRQAIYDAAFARWPFVRAPRDSRSFPDRVVFAPPELTSYKFDGLADAAEAQDQNAAVHDGLPDGQQLAVATAEGVVRWQAAKPAK